MVDLLPLAIDIVKVNSDLYSFDAKLTNVLKKNGVEYTVEKTYDIPNGDIKMGTKRMAKFILNLCPGGTRNYLIFQTLKDIHHPMIHHG